MTTFITIRHVLLRSLVYGPIDRTITSTALQHSPTYYRGKPAGKPVSTHQLSENNQAPRVNHGRPSFYPAVMVHVQVGVTDPQ